jgi:hypothetical protein
VKTGNPLRSVPETRRFRDCWAGSGAEYSAADRAEAAAQQQQGKPPAADPPAVLLSATGGAVLTRLRRAIPRVEIAGSREYHSLPRFRLLFTVHRSRLTAS